MTRTKIIAGNWKMNTTSQEASALIQALAESHSGWGLHDHKKVVIAPPFLYIQEAVAAFGKLSHLFVAAQNCSQYENGAYTGEVSADMLASVGAEYVLIGHSERREYFGETADILLAKIRLALSKGLTPVFCCGEPLGIREQGQTFAFIREQLETCIFQLPENEISQLVIAYEPIWAIGTGKTASPEQAQDVHAMIRAELSAKYSSGTAQGMTLLYGGSVNAKNAADLFSCPDIDGGLVGGASLQADNFITIIKAMK